MSLGARLASVFSAPGELFSNVARQPFSPANWLVPCTLVGLLSLIVILVLFSQPAILAQIQEMQTYELERRVNAGVMTQEQADQAVEGMKSDLAMTVMRVAGSIGGFITAFIRPFWWGLLGWLVARLIFHERLGFMRAVEVASLASLVEGLAAVIGLFLALGRGSLFAGPHMGFFIEDFDVRNRAHLAIGALNPFNLWQLALLALGIAKMIRRPFLSVGLALFVVWLVYKGLAVGLRLTNFSF
jgi:hypothetical protein